MAHETADSGDNNLVIGRTHSDLPDVFTGPPVVLGIIGVLCLGKFVQRSCRLGLSV